MLLLSLCILGEREERRSLIYTKWQQYAIFNILYMQSTSSVILQQIVVEDSLNCPGAYKVSGLSSLKFGVPKEV